jgi:hypothetical protein
VGITKLRHQYTALVVQNLTLASIVRLHPQAGQKMVSIGIVSSPRGSLSSQQILELANVYLENAFNATDSDIALVLCHDTEMSLSQAKKFIKHDKNQAVTKGVANAYIGLGKLLESRGHVAGAEASFKKAEKLG